MATKTRKLDGRAKTSAENYHLAVGNSLFKEGRSNVRLTRQEAARYAAVGSNVEIAAARNEYESFQVFIVCQTRDLKDVRLQMSPLVNEQAGRRILPHHVELFLVKSVRTRGRKPDRYWPDILWPYEIFDVPKGQLQPIWISVYVPKWTPAGEYRGVIKVCPANAPEQTVQVRLKVWDFALPDKTHLAIISDFTTLELGSRFYDFYPGSPRAQSAMICKYLRFLNDHRINTLLYGYITSRDPHILSIKQDSHGRLSYDFTKLDRYLQLLVDLGIQFNIFAPSFWQHAGSLFKINPLLGRFQHLGQGLFESDEFNQAVTDLLISYVRHLRRKGWLKNAFCFVWDEPPAERYDHMRRMCDLVKSVAPDVKRLTVANYPPMELAGYTDIWCPNVGGFEPTGPSCYEQYRDFYTQRQQAGDEVWWYIACAPHPFPNFFLDYPLLDCRIPFWLTWRYRLDGLGYYSTNCWHLEGPGVIHHGQNFHPKVADRWPNSDWDPSFVCSAGDVGGACTVAPCQGGGQLVYPGPNGPISSMRLKCIRDGIEDYEYLRLLERRSAALETRGNTPDREKLLRTSRRLLTDARRAASNSNNYERDAKLLMGLRGRIGRQIEALTRRLRK